MLISSKNPSVLTQKVMFLLLHKSEAYKLYTTLACKEKRRGSNRRKQLVDIPVNDPTTLLSLLGL